MMAWWIVRYFQVIDAARAVARVPANRRRPGVKNRGLEAIAAYDGTQRPTLAANVEDVARGRAEKMSEGLLILISFLGESVL